MSDIIERLLELDRLKIPVRIRMVVCESINEIKRLEAKIDELTDIIMTQKLWTID